MRCKSLFTFGAGFIDEGTSYQCELTKGHKGQHRHEPKRKSKYSRGDNGVIAWNTKDEQEKTKPLSEIREQLRLRGQLL
jgi:hypothetical protein